MMDSFYDYIKSKASDLWGGVTNAVNRGAVLASLPAKVPALASVAAGAVVSNKILKQQYDLGTIVGTGFNIKGSTILDKFVDLKGVDLSVPSGSGSLLNMFQETKKQAGQTVDESHVNSGLPDLPFWAKTAIVASVIIGTVLIVKGAFNE